MFEIHLDKHFVLPTGNITIPDNKDTKGIGNNNRIFLLQSLLTGLSEIVLNYTQKDTNS